MAKRYSNLNPFKSLAYLKVSNSTKAQKHKSTKAIPIHFQKVH